MYYSNLYFKFGPFKYVATYNIESGRVSSIIHRHTWLNGPNADLHILWSYASMWHVGYAGMTFPEFLAKLGVRVPLATYTTYVWQVVKHSFHNLYWRNW